MHWHFDRSLGCFLNLAYGQAADGMPWQRSRRFFECSREHGHWHATVPHGSRGVPLSLISFDANARIGEASNLGLYTVGGGSASSGGGVQSLSEQRAAWRNSLTSKMIAAEAVPEDFSVPVVCRDVNLQHQSDVRWYFAPDVAGVLQDELCGETWRESDLTAYIRKIFDDGEGVLDPAKLVIGESDFGAYDHEYGWVARDDLPLDPRLLPAPISSVAERAARDRAERDDIVAELIQEMGGSSRIERHATSFANLATNAAARIFPPEIVEEETGKELDPSIQAAVTARAQQLTVGPAVERSRRPPRRRRKGDRPPVVAWPGTTTPPTPTSSAEVLAVAYSEGKRCKQGRRAKCEVLILNSSGPPQLRAALLTCDPSVMAILNQEHHCSESSFVDLQYDARSAGWKLHGAHAAKTADGFSAGVCIATRTSVGRGLIHDSCDHSPRVSPGRFAAAWLQIGPDTGIVMGSIYMYHSEGSSIRNRKLLEHAVAVLSAYGSPWVLGGDFNVAPDEMVHLFAHVLEQGNAYVFATDLPTHCPTVGRHRTLDYLLCSGTASHWIDKVYVDYGVAASPHRAVRVKLKAERHNFTAECLRTPKHFPRQKPIGCARELVLLELPPVTHLSSPEGSGHTSSLDSLAQVWPALAHAIETELCWVTDCASRNGLAQKAYSGRAQGVRTANILVLPKRASASLARSTRWRMPSTGSV